MKLPEASDLSWFQVLVLGFFFHAGWALFDLALHAVEPIVAKLKAKTGA